jgi:hypothetical protein
MEAFPSCGKSLLGWADKNSTGKTRADNKKREQVMQLFFFI